jgi:hypothetical protein
LRHRRTAIGDFALTPVLAGGCRTTADCHYRPIAASQGARFGAAKLSFNDPNQARSGTEHDRGTRKSSDSIPSSTDIARREVPSRHRRFSFGAAGPAVLHFARSLVNARRVT